MRLMLLAALLACVLLGGCANPILSPNTAAAIADQAVEDELRKQTAEMKQQTALLREIRDNTRRAQP